MRFLPLLLCLAACASNEGIEVKRVGELPTEYRDLWVAFADEDPNYPELREEALTDPGRTTFLVENLTRTMLISYRRGEFAKAGDMEVHPFERCRAELIRLGEASVPTLAELMAIGDGTVAHICSELLVEIGRPSLGYVTSMLDREDPEERARVVVLLRDLPNGKAEEDGILAALADRLASDEDWLVRKSCAETMGYRGARHLRVDECRSALSRALSDEDIEVSKAAALALGRLNDVRAVPALLNFLERAHREADIISYESCQISLRALTGQKSSRTPREWRDWWRANRPRPDRG